MDQDARDRHTLPFPSRKAVPDSSRPDPIAPSPDRRLPANGSWRPRIS